MAGGMLPQLLCFQWLGLESIAALTGSVFKWSLADELASVGQRPAAPGSSSPLPYA